MIVNGALDKLRQGYYARWLFPKIAEVTDRFITNFEPIFYLKPLTDKGLYGWLYKIYGEPWQVVLQLRDSTVVAQICETRPAYNDCIAFLKQKAMEPTSK